MLLAAELEHQPWAVQVKAIPTATVPVVKLLADAAGISRRSSSIGSRNDNECLSSQNPGVDWATGISQHMKVTTQSNNSNAGASQHFVSNVIPPGTILAPYLHPWRGADVMNGLIKIDITFEGPEHGGIGSTAFTARIVQEACNETGLSPEATPVVQLTMVLKELLAQRRLNEPFSGGLSSYALLLMVVAVIRERRAIKGEMELVERQRRAVASTTSNSSFSAAPIKSVANRSKSLGATPSRSTADVKASSVYSWASVAKKAKPSCSKSEKKLNNNCPRPPSILDKHRNQENTSLEPVESSSNHVSRSFKHSSSNATVCTSPTVASTRSSSSLPCNVSDTKNASAGNSVISTVSSSFGLSHGSNDVLEVLCSGEPTAGKLLMHFLLFYGRHFDSPTMIIDVTAPFTTGKGPFLPRQAGGSIDPYTGMLTVDPIVVFDPLEGSEGNNVSRSCFAWQNVKWVFGQCFNTLTHTMERKSRVVVNGVDDCTEESPLLELLLSY